MQSHVLSFLMSMEDNYVEGRIVFGEEEDTDYVNVCCCMLHF